MMIADEVSEISCGARPNEPGHESTDFRLVLLRQCLLKSDEGSRYFSRKLLTCARVSIRRSSSSSSGVTHIGLRTPELLRRLRR